MVAGRRVQAPGAADRQARAADGGRRLPVPAPAAGVGARVTGDRTAGGRRAAPGDAAAPGSGEAGGGGVLYVVATPIGNLGDVTLRALEVLRRGAARRRRGHAPDAAAARPARHRDADDRASTPRARRRAWRRSLEHLRGGADLALVTDAGTPVVSDPGADLVAAWAGGGRPGRADPRRVGRAGGRGGDRRRRSALDVRGVPAAVRARATRAARARSPPTRGARSSSRRPAGCAATLRDLAAACGADRPAAVCRELTKLHETDRARLARRARRGRRRRHDPGPRRGRDRRRDARVGRARAGVGRVGTGTARRCRERGSPADDDPTAAARAEVERLVADGVARGDAARRVAAATGIPRRQLYGAARRRQRPTSGSVPSRARARRPRPTASLVARSLRRVCRRLAGRRGDLDLAARGRRRRPGVSTSRAASTADRRGARRPPPLRPGEPVDGLARPLVGGRLDHEPGARSHRAGRASASAPDARTCSASAPTAPRTLVGHRAGPQVALDLERWR